MDWERALLGACHVGAMQRLLEGTVRHARTRKQFGQLIGKNQAVSHKIADMKVGLEAARWLVYRAAASLGVSQIGRASGREHGCQYVYISVVAVSLTKKHYKHEITYQEQE